MRVAIAIAASFVWKASVISAAEGMQEATSTHSRAKVAVAEWTGSTGSTAARVIRETLADSGDFDLANSEETGAYLVLGSSSGGRIKGELRNPQGKMLFTENYDHLDLRVNAHAFADEIISAVFGRPGISSTQIAFVAATSGRKEIYMCGADGTDVRRITNDESLAVSPSLRCDAVYLAFTSYVTGYPDVYLIDLRSGGRRRVITAPGTNSGAAFSPDGERLAMTMSFAGNPELYVTNPGGHGGRRLSTTDYIEASPSWSPDGKRLVYTSTASGRPQLFIVSEAGGEAKQVPTGFAYCTEPSWSPDANRIAYNIRQGSTISVAIHNLASGKSYILAQGEDPCWGADGRHLVYSKGEYLVVRNVDSGIERRIATNLGQVSEPTWSR